LRVERVQYDAGLDHDLVRANRNDSAEMATEIEHQSASERPTSGIGSSPARMHGDPVLRRIADQGDHIVLAPGDDDTQRINFVKTGVVSERRTIKGLEIEFPLDDSP
jgi:hypothetical protein